MNRINKGFTHTQKKAILKRDDYKCVMCGRGERETLFVNYIISKEVGGKTRISNGQTLCDTHKFDKSKNKQKENGRQMFIRLYKSAKEAGDEETMSFCEEVLKVYKRKNINGHIEWKK